MTEIYYAEDDPDIGVVEKEYLDRVNVKVSILGTLAGLRQA